MNTIAQSRAVRLNRVLVNTYQLLSATLIFSGLMAYLSMYLQLPHFGLLITLGGYLGLLYLTNKLKNSAGGILAVFALTGFMGLTLGPMLSSYISAFSNGAELISMAMAGTGLIFLTLSFYVITSGKDFSFMRGMLMVGLVVVVLALIANYFMQIPALSLTISAVIILLMSGFILFETSNIIHGGETNYIMATVSLFVSIFNIFVHLLSILGVFSGDD
ncbi:Putative TEGT family carrier/transport protein [uncultured Gammaproteobacteria bacterium]|nr:Putative TEGT family carrier/transport protein [uncultured Gammaproteobacteria bacterium]SMN16788.1 Putative TEGT family carrier/transport protein [uncultured Candidatus Thioglobus sp.]